MSDPFETLKRLDAGPMGAPLPASEVRRRGDRLRRRRTAVRIAGAACAVAVISTGGIALGSMGPDAATNPGPSAQASDRTADATPDGAQDPKPSEKVNTTIPEGFPLAAGWPTDTGSDDELAGPGPEVRAFDEVEVCGRAVYPTTTPADRLAATYTAPEDLRARELTTYADETTARAAFTSLVNAYRDCPRESSGGTPESVTFTEVRENGLGDEGYTVVETYEVDGAPALGLGQVQVVRVGNALLLASSSNESGPDKRSVETAVRTEQSAVAPVADAMCVYSDSGCGDAGPADELDSALLTLEDLRSVTRDLATDWAARADRENPTLDCQADWLSSLGSERLAYREFAGTGSSGVVNTEAATAVLEYVDQAAARAAYDTVAGWVRSCEDRLDGTRPLSIRHDPVALETGFGPSTWRVLESPAPEICTECGTGWIDAQGVALVGNRVTLLSVAYTGDMGSGADTASSPMVKGIRIAAARAAGGARSHDDSTIGPLGIGELELGMYTWEAPAASLVRTTHPGPCEGFVIKALPKPSDDTVDGFASENLGVMTLFARDGMATPEGIALGATEQEVRAAYPHAEVGVHGWSVPVAGFADRSYLFGFEDGQVVELALTLDSQHCFG